MAQRRGGLTRRRWRRPRRRRRVLPHQPREQPEPENRRIRLYIIIILSNISFLHTLCLNPNWKYFSCGLENSQLSSSAISKLHRSTCIWKSQGIHFCLHKYFWALFETRLLMPALLICRILLIQKLLHLCVCPHSPILFATVNKYFLRQGFCAAGENTLCLIYFLDWDEKVTWTQWHQKPKYNTCYILETTLYWKYIYMEKKFPLFLSCWGEFKCRITCASHEEGEGLREGLRTSALREASLWNSFKAMERFVDPFQALR